MILVIDNYDSFTYNLVQYIGTINPNLQVHRNDQITLDEIKSLSENELTLVLNDIKNLAVGNISSSSSFAEIQLAANYYNSQYDIVNNVVFYSSLIIALALSN